MKVFDGRKAAEDYMAAHTLTFSTPDLTLKRFAFWLGDNVPDPQNKEKGIPRAYTYVEEKDFEPVRIIDDEQYVPSGAVKTTGMYGNPGQMSGDGKFCAQCGTKMSSSAKFCPGCGVTCDA